MAEAIRIALEKGPLTGKSVKEATETLRNYDPMGLAPAISYFPNDHRPTMSVHIYQMKGGQLSFLATRELERKAEWLGK